jgi:hypothetical protein
VAGLAIAISIVALLVAGVSAWFTRAQAVAVREANDLEKVRLHEERRPRVGVEHVRRDPQTKVDIFRFRNEGSFALSDLEVRLVEHGEDPSILTGITFDPSGDFTPSDRLGPMGVGEHELLRGVRNPTVRGNVVVFRMTAFDGDASWQLVEAVTITTPRSGTVWAF